MRVVLGGAMGAIPGLALVPLLSFYAMLVLVPMGVIAGAMVAAAPDGRVLSTAVGASIGVMVAVPFSMVGTRPSLLLAPAIVLAGCIAGRRWGDGQATPGSPAIEH